MNAQSAKIIFRDVTGRIIKSVQLYPGEGELTVTASQLSKGVYTYSLEVDDIVQDVKTMLH